MRFVAIDVGMGTQDILLYDSERNVENCFKMVLPSQTQIVAKRIARETGLERDIVLTGETMGGGPCANAVRGHIEADFNVFATEKAALTVDDDLDKVMEMGVVIVSEDEADELKASRIEMCDVDKPALVKAFGLFGLSLPRDFAVAVQDHGYSTDVSNRLFRFEYFRDMMKKGCSLDSFAYKGNIPARFSRMKAVERTVPGALLMDTGIAAIRGALLDASPEPCLAVNIGNGHTLAGIVDCGRLVALFEHHTHMLTPAKLDDYLMRLCDGTLGFQEVFEEGGHGCHIDEIIGFDKIGGIIVTGPLRHIMHRSKLPVKFAAPYGDMMLTGCYGLMDAYLNYTPD